MATLLERGAQTHQARLVGHVSLYEPAVWHRFQDLVATFVARGADPATAEQQAWRLLYDGVREQALFLAFLDDFWRLAIIFASVIPLLVFLRRPRRPAAGGIGEGAREGAVLEA